MNTFAFVSNKDPKQKNMQNLFVKYVKTYWTLNIFKVGGLVFVWFFVILSYLYNVNIASTSGYFLRQANQEYDSIVFKSEILKTKFLLHKQENWDQLYDHKYGGEVVNVQTEIVYVPKGSDLVMR